MHNKHEYRPKNIAFRVVIQEIDTDSNSIISESDKFIDRKIDIQRIDNAETLDEFVKALDPIEEVQSDALQFVKESIGNCTASSMLDCESKKKECTLTDI